MNGNGAILSMKGITKSFGPVQALDGVDFDVHPGEVVALVGDNGAGKSTLVKAIAGIYTIDSGEFFFDGQPVKISGPNDATDLGIATVYQDLALCDNLDVVANLFLGQETLLAGPGRAFRALDEIEMEQRSHELLDQLSVTIPSVRSEVGTLSGGQRQQVAVARSLLGEPKVVMLDEPTAALGVPQTKQVLALINRLRERNLGVIVISHNLSNVFEVADRIYVLRLGRKAGVYGVKEATEEQIVGAITGATMDTEEQRMQPMRVAVPDPAAPEDAGAVRTSPRDLLRRFLQGDLASLRVIMAIAVIWIIFQSQNDRFLTAGNLTNLFLQITAVGLISVGVVLVLLIGEIDLSVGAVSGFAAAVMAVLNVKQGWPAIPAVAAGVMTGALIGLAQGLLFTRFTIPSFVVTLAGSLVWQGALLKVLGNTGTVNLSNSSITDLANTFYGDAVGWIFAAAVIAIYAAFLLAGHRPTNQGGGDDRAGRPAGDPDRGDGRGDDRRRRDPQLRPRPAAGADHPLRLRRRLPAADHADDLRPPPVRGRRQRRGGAPRRHRRREDPHHRLHARLLDGGGRRHPRRLAPARGQPELGRQQPAAGSDRRPGRRRHQPLRRPWLGLVGAARRHRDRLDRQRHEPAGAGILGQADDHRRRSARRGHHRRRRPLPPPRRGPGLRSRSAFPCDRNGNADLVSV